MSATTVSPSTTLWATASKEWVIPAKPKPGRKPKKDTAQAVEEAPEVDSKGRRVQNRAAQRAFRERKQSQLAELQARVQQYEQGEMERNVALQNIAKRLKEENEKLRSENVLLKEKVGQLEGSLIAQDPSRKRTRGESLLKSPCPSSVQSARKKHKLSLDPSNFSALQGVSTPYDASPSPSSSGSSDSSTSQHSSHTSFSPLPTMQSPQDMQMGNGMDDVFDLSSDTKSTFFEGGPLSCGFCTKTTACVCKDITLQQVSDQLNLSDTSLQDHQHQREVSTSQTDLQTPTLSNGQSSILDNLPEYQAPVPLRRRSPVNSQRPVFPISSSPDTSNAAVASCSGDPSNCMACADDAFGKAFCDAIGKSVASTSLCGYCPEPSQMPDNSSNGSSVGGCCGNPMACGGLGCGPSIDTSSSSNGGTAPSMMMNDLPSASETVSCDSAWRQLKCHPNVAFTDLSLLAEVVARRSKCSGPRVEIYPPPGSLTPERGLSPSTSVSSRHPDMDNLRISLSGSRAQYDSRSSGKNAPSPPPQLVPQEVLISCGRQRVREVMADGVRDALRLLDAKFPIPNRPNDYRN